MPREGAFRKSCRCSVGGKTGTTRRGGGSKEGGSSSGPDVVSSRDGFSRSEGLDERKRPWKGKIGGGDNVTHRKEHYLKGKRRMEVHFSVCGGKKANARPKKEKRGTIERKREGEALAG